ncbi:hypothetical protein JYU34_021798 [Plutella xylostella]|uniref:DUF7043 domain-containing protein n=1 Tax=Plutella xylostella TaxID=51655 RepID=A0ABQ7PRF7_PLUXY|nr:hypothetical protein JYU34_021798 [Plutella xylostella]
MMYYIAQSGDATCNGLSSPTDGSRTMRLTNSDDEHHRCHFPSWIVEHHKWFSLDHSHQYHFTTKNATLKIMNEDGSSEEKRLVCHSILEQKDKKHIKLVAHVTRGCESGHVCLVFHRRGAHVLELAQGAGLWDAPEDACATAPLAPAVTLTTTSLQPTRCPIFGRYSIVSSLADRRRRRQQDSIGDNDGRSAASPECVAGVYDSVSVGCGAQQDSLEFKSHCASTVYTCYGSWSERGFGFLVAAPVARASSQPSKHCFMYTRHNDTREGGQILSLSAVARSCDRSIIPGVTGDKAYNLTINGTCEQSSKYNSYAPRPLAQAYTLLTSLLVAMATPLARR